MSLPLMPHISEKAVAMADAGVYVFDVPMSANKITVAQAVQEAFKVEVTDVNMIVSKGKVKRFQKTTGKRKDTKKAYVQLKAGQKLSIFEGSN